MCIVFFSIFIDDYISSCLDMLYLNAGTVPHVLILLVLIRGQVTTVKKVNKTIKGNKLQGVAVCLIQIHRLRR